MSETTGNWKAIFENWRLFCAPARPNNEVCLEFSKIIDKVIKDKTNSKILILGSTPEFRDLCYKFSLIYDAEVICVDISSDNYKAMTALTKHKNKNEGFINANWLDIPLENKFVDVIISDAGISNIDFDSRKKFYTEISRVLKKDGTFITREDILTEECKEFDFKKALEEYSDKVLNNELTLLQAVNNIGEICLRISALNNNYKTGCSYFDKEIDEIENESDNKLILQILKLLKNTFLINDSEYWVILPKEKFEQELKEFFDIEKVIVNNSYELAELLPIYVLGK